jgi:SAM-dependent methyltransferase
VSNNILPMSLVIHRRCPDCSTDNTNTPPTAFGDDVWKIKRCRNCGFTYLENAPVYDRLIEEFAWERTSASEAQRREAREPVRQYLSDLAKAFRRRWMKRAKLSDLVRRHVPPGNVLDIGCAGGGMLSALDACYAPHGIEVSQALAGEADAIARQRGGYVIHDNALAGLAKFPPDYFSGILMSAFLEHEMNPRQLLGEAWRSLRVGGCCIIKVPNFASVNRVLRGARWCGFRLPDHVNYFTPADLSRMCREAGFSIRQFGLRDRLPTSDNMWIVLEKATAPEPSRGR